MLQLPRRTDVTELTDNELIIMDALFDRPRPMWHLQDEYFCEEVNFPAEHAHTLDVYELMDVVGRFIARDWLTREKRGKEIWHGLTPAGGELWEIERRPDWDRYVRTSSWSEPTASIPQWIAEVVSPSVEIAVAFWKCDRDVKVEKAALTILEDYPLVYWKKFPAVYQIIAPYSPLLDWPSVDWDVYEENRVWWRDLMELGGLQK